METLMRGFGRRLYFLLSIVRMLPQVVIEHRAVGRVHIVGSFSRPEVYAERCSGVGICKSGSLVRVIVNVGFFHLLYSLLTGKRITGQEIVAVIVIFHLLPEQKRSEVSYLRFTGIDISALIGYKALSQININGTTACCGRAVDEDVK